MIWILIIFYAVALLSLNLSLYLHAKSDILEDIGNVLHEASAGIVVVGFVSNIFINVAERR